MTERPEVNLKNNLFFHGTRADSAECIEREGFRRDCGGNLGAGNYVSCNWRMALWFGSTLLRIAIAPGTKILDAATPPDGKTIDYLTREFGREILHKAPWKVLPKNKRLTQKELVALFRHHYFHAWVKEYGESECGLSKWPQKREVHSRLLSSFRSLLIRFGFHGYGNPSDDNGTVVLESHRLLFAERIVSLTCEEYDELEKSDFRTVASLSELRARFGNGR